MSGIGSGYSDREYDARKKAHDKLERELHEKGGVSREKAKEVADRIARETDNQQRQNPKKPQKKQE